MIMYGRLRQISFMFAFATNLLTVCFAESEVTPLEVRSFHGLQKEGCEVALMLMKPKWVDNSGLVFEADHIYDEPASFHSIVTKEPEPYRCDTPFRSVIKYGSRLVAFAFDSSDLLAKGYDTLYVDRNGNGDLTDDGVYFADPLGKFPMNLMEHEARWDETPTDTHFNFFRTVTIPSKEANGNWVDLPFFAASNAVINYETQALQYAEVLLTPYFYREGVLSVGDEKHGILLVDRNANGTFNDPLDVGDVDERLIRKWGFDIAIRERRDFDIALLDPPADRRSMGVFGARAIPLSDYLVVGGACYASDISTLGDKVGLEPHADVGYVRNPAETYFIKFCQGKTLVCVQGQKSERISLPVGQWRLLNYSIGPREPEDDPELHTGLYGSFEDSPVTVSVRRNKTVDLPFGPPLEARISPSRGQGNKVEFLLSVKGLGGEKCGSIRVRGKYVTEWVHVRVLDEGGKEVYHSQFQHGGSTGCRCFWDVPTEHAERYRIALEIERGPFKFLRSKPLEIRMSDLGFISSLGWERISDLAARLDTSVESGDRRRAKKISDQLLEALPNDPKSLDEISVKWAIEEKRFYHAAVLAASKALKVQPDMPQSFNSLVYPLMDHNGLDWVIPSLEDAIGERVQGDFPRLAVALASRGHPADVERAYLLLVQHLSERRSGSGGRSRPPAQDYLVEQALMLLEKYPPSNETSRLRRKVLKLMAGESVEGDE